MEIINGFYIPNLDEEVGEDGDFHYNYIEVDAYNTIHDCFYDTQGYTIDIFKIYQLYNAMPREIVDLAKMWGWDDTEVRDKVYVLLEDIKFKLKGD